MELPLANVVLADAGHVLNVIAQAELPAQPLMCLRELLDLPGAVDPIEILEPGILPR
jgi:hypothetical protein